jgi:hypothetical protein
MGLLILINLALAADFNYGNIIITVPMALSRLCSLPEFPGAFARLDWNTEDYPCCESHFH